jgi:hypothetical protein
VAWLVRVKASRQLDCAQDRRNEANAETLQFGPNKAVIESGIVSDEESPRQSLKQLTMHIFKKRGISNHGVRNTGKRLDLRWNSCARVDQGAPPALAPVAVNFDQPDFDDAMARRVTTRCLQIDTDYVAIQTTAGNCAGQRISLQRSRRAP